MLDEQYQNTFRSPPNFSNCINYTFLLLVYEEPLLLIN